MVPCSALYSGSSAPSSGQMDAGPPLISVECPTGAPPSQPTCPIEISSREFDPSPSTLEPELRPDHDVCTNAGGHLAAPSISCGADATPDGRPPSNSPSAEATRIDGPPSFDAPISVVHSHANDSAGGVSTFDTKCMSSETRGDELSRSAPPFTREHPVEHSPQAGPAFPSPSKSVHPNANFPSRTAVTASAVSVSCASENLPLPRPPPEVAALLSAQSSGRAVSPIVARDSPLVRWELPSAIGYFWLGFFWISAVKVIFMSAYLSEKTISIHRESFFSFPRWKHVYGKKVARRRRRRPSRCNVPGAFFWNGCPEARTSSRTSGHISCRRGGNRSIPSSSQTNNPCSSHLRVSQALLLYPNGPISQSRAQSPGILPCYYRSLSSRPSPRPLPRPVLSPQAIIAHHVVASTCSAFFDIVFVRVPRATQG
jgi:hypothetical protein